jgi:hypothetical protein
MFGLMEESTRLLTATLATGYQALHEAAPQVSQIIGR